MKTAKVSAKKAAKKEEKKKDLGLGLEEPKEGCDDSKCAWHGGVSIRGRVFRGRVRSAKSHNTVIVEWGYHRFVRKYQRYERSRSRVTAHNPPCMRAKEGDSVVIAECRPLSKTKGFVVVKVGGKE
ncbi:MAG: 30S ribosomal protein S17 [Candidatus Aenigmarchaeota archaeon]|nr:30S ribosomal protein S17 [Candidatus Aenigmarchaeota archaeon]NIP41018.1 30S ribosomal protein S17 [Candidatus Aenigmarchaeota archaeon]NIQ17420.1 30S ribosomal protein S17 [Candidatus Aenigmarchaeota archaeon]NIS73614.1 30S ribosomal protein S17 [Candidatus Aenigmarchaeota archaeon]